MSVAGSARVSVCAAALIASLSCAVTPGGASCEDAAYRDQPSSSYLLPWAAGESYPVVNANCGRGLTHNRWVRFAYDFHMPIGAGVVDEGERLHRLAEDPAPALRRRR